MSVLLNGLTLLPIHRFLDKFEITAHRVSSYNAIPAIYSLFRNHIRAPSRPETMPDEVDRTHLILHYVAATRRRMHYAQYYILSERSSGKHFRPLPQSSLTKGREEMFARNGVASGLYIPTAFSDDRPPITFGHVQRRNFRRSLPPNRPLPLRYPTSAWRQAVISRREGQQRWGKGRRAKGRVRRLCGTTTGGKILSRALLAGH